MQAQEGRSTYKIMESVEAPNRIQCSIFLVRAFFPLIQAYQTMMKMKAKREIADTTNVAIGSTSWK